jgi:hypothetical protein
LIDELIKKVIRLKFPKKGALIGFIYGLSLTSTIFFFSYLARDSIEVGGALLAMILILLDLPILISLVVLALFGIDRYTFATNLWVVILLSTIITSLIWAAIGWIVGLFLEKITAQ